MTTFRPKHVSDLAFEPLTPARWPDLVRLFGERGACGGCWCMAWRLKSADFARRKGAKNRAAFRRIVRRGPPPGVLAYRGGEAIGWCAVAPRAELRWLEGSRVLSPIDNAKVWSISCLFVARPARRSGISVELLRAAADFAGRHGARIVEGYPVVPRTGALPDVFAWTGTLSAFLRAGFSEAARRSKARPIVRRQLRPAR
ncbi:MAG TPA: GNAT family N-acetyltransferase [Gemmatimonadaceae bacterium]|nr:GNAT family N-acetyltransferase [Gemmatimonadaceae bacterium]